MPPKKTGVLKDLEVAFGDHEIPGFWECGRASSVTEVAFGDHEIPSPEKNGFLADAELVAIERSLTKEVNVAEGMVDRALVCTMRAIASALEERRSFRMPATFGQDVVDQLLAASTHLSKAFSELYSVHEALIEARSEAIAQAQSPATEAA